MAWLLRDFECSETLFVPIVLYKGAAELVIKSYFNSFFNNKDSNVRLGIGRAGNVVGGGDWAAYRIVPDCICIKGT